MSLNFSIGRIVALSQGHNLPEDVHIVQTIGSQMVATLSALHTSCTLLPRNIIFLLLVLISVRDWVNPGA
jgi:hypothetical protein